MDTIAMINALKADFTKHAKRVSDNLVVILFNNFLFSEVINDSIPIVVTDEWDLVTVKRKLSGIVEAIASISNGKIVEYHRNSNEVRFQRVALKSSIFIQGNVPEVQGRISSYMIDSGDWYEYLNIE